MTPAQLDALVTEHNRQHSGKRSRPEPGGVSDLMAFARMRTGA